MRSALRRLALAGLLLTGLAAAAPPPATGERGSAGESPPWAAAYLGHWSLYEDGEGGLGCTLTFAPGMAIGGAPIALSPACRQNFPVQDVAAWTIDDPRAKTPHILFIDALRKVVLDFAPLEGFPRSAALPDRDGLPRPQALLERDRDKPSRRTIRQLMTEGGFDLSGPDMKEWCGFTTTAASAMGGELEQQGRCARRWKGKGWASWEVRDGVLLLKSRAGAVLLRLKRGDATTFVGGTDADPLFFGPGVIQMS